MSHSHAMIRRIAVASLWLTTGLSAQRYTGHDHAVFHRQPQAPPVATKHQSPSAGNTAASHQKTTTPASAPAQQGPRASAGQGKLDVDVNHNSSPSKTDPPLESIPRL